uniref:Zinc finger protein 549 n=3 Tax=Catarrhini TaxID=9526 RepID=A0A2K5Z194_MANLE
MAAAALVNTPQLD